MPKIRAGDRAPDFTLPTHTGETMHLAEEVRQGPVVLIFYPMDDTPGCTAQLTAVRADRDRYASAGITVYGINNGNAESHQRFAQKYGIDAPLLIDPELSVARAYGAFLGIGRFGIIDRTVVGVDPDGTIAFYRHGMPSTDEILAGMRPPDT